MQIIPSVPGLDDRSDVEYIVGLLCQSVGTVHLGYLSAFRVKNLRLLVEKIQSLMLLGALPSQETIKLN